MIVQAHENECSVTVAPARSAYSRSLAIPAIRLAGLPEVLLNQAHGHAALSHRGRDPLDRTGPNVADREHAWQAALQEVRVSARLVLKARDRCGSTCIPWPLGQRGDGLVYRRDGAGAFAGGCGDPLHRAGVDVADREHGGDAGLERERSPSQP